MQHEKYKIGYTTGTFDVFHIGHLNLLEKAKSQSEYLIVGVSTDELVKEYKGSYPLIPFEDRLRIIAALRCVDKVVVQETLDKFTAWKVLHFNALFHGSDWKNTPLYNDAEKRLKEVGVDCIFFPYTRNVSSHDIRKQISKK